MSNACDKRQAAKRLAESHYRTDKATIAIHCLTADAEAESNPDEPIKLLEVNDATIASGIMPLYFPSEPASGIPFRSVVVEVTPHEFDTIKSGQLPLPNGWLLGDELPHPAGEAPAQ